MQNQSTKQVHQTTSTSCFRGHLIFKQDCRCCRSFKNDWYNQLKISGFDDAESRESQTRYESTIDRINRLSKASQGMPEKLQSEMTYYRWVSETAVHASFRSETDKKIWQLHAEGFTQKRIESIVHIGQTAVCKRLKRIKKYIANQVIGSLSIEVSA